MRLLAVVVGLGLSLGCGFTSPIIWNLLTASNGPVFDQTFLSMMLAHYEGLLEIESAFVPQVKDRQLQALISEIIAADKARIAGLKNRLRTPHKEAFNIMQGEMDKDIAVLRANLSVGKEPISVFANLIMANSASATGMANLAKDRSQNALVLKFAKELVQAEQVRTEQIQVWLIEHSQ